MTYDIVKIKKPRYKKLVVFIPLIKSLSTLSKTMIFVYSNNEEMILIEYLYTKFSNDLKNKAK